MYKVYKVLSGEEWNGQNRPEDFEKVEFVCDVETREELNELLEDSEDLIYVEV